MNKVRTLLLSVTMLGSLHASAKYGIPKGPASIEVGYSFCVARAQFKYMSASYNESTGQFKDTSFIKDLTSQSGFGGLIGYYWPVSKLGEKSRVAIGVTYMYNAYLWDGNTFAYSSNSQTGTTSVGSGTVEMALPVGADYKYGCDALRDRSERLCYSLGAGVYPSMSATVYRGDGGFVFKVRPYVRAEAGFFAGICMKVRATYVFGNMNYIEYGHTNPGDVEKTTLSSKGTLALSLVLMPMSWKFGRTSDWW